MFAKICNWIIDEKREKAHIPGFDKRRTRAQLLKPNIFVYHGKI